MSKPLRKKFRFVISIILVLAMLGGSCVWAASSSDVLSNNTYTYPVLPGTKAWSKLNNAEEKRRACHVNESILKNMTTKTLVETVVKYPLLPDIYAYASIEMGIKMVSCYFDGITVLFERSDALQCLLEYANSESERSVTTDISYYNADALISVLDRKVVNPSRDTVTYVYTPNNNAVMAYYDLTWSDHNTTQVAALAESYALQNIYSSMVQAAPVDPSYNCHSYAWHDQSTSNRYWIDNPAMYMNDGSYNQTSCSAGSKIYYNSYGNEHSGIVVSVGSDLSNTTVISKWGYLGLYTHKADDCPYYSSSVPISYWY